MNLFYNFSATNALIGWNISNFAGFLLVAGTNIQYAAPNGSISNVVLVDRHRNAGLIVFPSIHFDGFVVGIIGVRIHHSEGEERETSIILQLGTELCCFGCISVAAAGRQRFK